MNELARIEQTMSSIEIADATGRQHKDILRAIRNMEQSWEKVTGRKFALSEYTDKSGRRLPCYSLTKTECLYIATKFNDEARARLILRWERLEMECARLSQPKVPVLSRAQILLYALQAEEEVERLRDISLSLLSEKYCLQAENAQLRRTVSQSAVNVLTRAGLVRIEPEIWHITEEQLRRYRGCGENTIEGVKRIITMLTGRKW